MTILDSLLVDAFGLAIVFVVLIALSLIIKLISKIFGGMKEKEDETERKQQVSPSEQKAQSAGGELELYDVDERTAALIMAIVSDESKIPLPELQFKSIRLMK